MNRTNTIRTSALLALPFLLLPAGVWLVNTSAEIWQVEVAWFYPWQGARWLLRAVYVGGAVMGWRAGRPIWFYPWLGFAVYEVVAVLMLLAAGPLARLWVTLLGDGPIIMLGGVLYLLVVSSSPCLAVSLWRRKQPLQRLLAAFTVFPAAALTLPLFFSAVIAEDSGGLPNGMMQLGIEGMPPLATLVAAVSAAICAVFFWRPPMALFRGRENLARMVFLFGGVPLSHSLFLIPLIAFSFGETLGGFDDAPLFLISAGLGWLILSGPLLFPPLLQRLIRLLRVERAIACL